MKLASGFIGRRRYDDKFAFNDCTTRPKPNTNSPEMFQVFPSRPKNPVLTEKTQIRESSANSFESRKPKVNVLGITSGLWKKLLV
jgi:hypothetical protein